LNWSVDGWFEGVELLYLDKAVDKTVNDHDVRLKFPQFWTFCEVVENYLSY
jgi:hypothetical protein